MVDPLRILFLHSSADLYGSDRSLLRIVTGLDKNFFRPFVVLPCEGPLKEKIVRAGVPVRVMELGILRRRHATPWGALRQFFAILAADFRLARFARTERIALIQSNTLAVVSGVFAARLAGVPHAWYVREIVESPVAVRNLLAFALRRFSDRIIAVSQAVRQHWTGLQPGLEEKMVVVPSGLEEPSDGGTKEDARKQLGLAPEGVYVGLVGRINRVKGHGVLLDAAKDAWKAHPSARFVCVGDASQGEDWRRNELVQRIARENAGDRFFLRPFMEDMAVLYRAMDIVAVPSVAPDAFPAVCIEAGLHGKPVLAFAVGGIGEIVQDGKTGLCVAPGDTAAFRRRLEELLGDTALRDKMGRAGREYCVRNFSLSGQIARLQEIYKEMAGPCASR